MAAILKSMRARSFRFIFLSTITLGALLAATGCRGHGDPFNMSANPAAWTSAKNDARRQLDTVPLPSKGTHVVIDQEAQWQNPFLTVESNMIQIRIYLADQNASQVDRGGLTRLSAARKYILNVRLKDLPQALVSLPDSAWPYGRVVALSEDSATQRNQARLRNNVTVTAATLNDMDVVVDDWTHRSPTR